MSSERYAKVEKPEKSSPFAAIAFFVAFLADSIEVVFSIREYMEYHDTYSGEVTGSVVMTLALVFVCLNAVCFFLIGFFLIRNKSKACGVSTVMNGIFLLGQYSILFYGIIYAFEDSWKEFFIDRFGFGFIYFSMLCIVLSYIVSGIVVYMKKTGIVTSVAAPALYFLALLSFLIFAIKSDASSPVRFYHVFNLPVWVSWIELIVPFAGITLTGVSLYKKRS